MRWFDASPRRATPKGQTFITCTAPHQEALTYLTSAPLRARGAPKIAEGALHIQCRARFTAITTPESACRAPLQMISRGQRQVDTVKPLLKNGTGATNRGISGPASWGPSAFLGAICWPLLGGVDKCTAA